jgi:hypothetical protein
VTLSLFAVALDAVLADWRQTPLAELRARWPGGRLACTLLLPGLGAADDALPAAHAARRAPAADTRALFEALVEDRAAAHLFDAPRAGLSAAARVLGLRPLDGGAPTAYPAEVSARDGGLVVWATERGAGDATGAESLTAELVEALGPLVEAAAAPGMALLALAG